MKNIFTRETTDELIERINYLSPATTPQWGKMAVGQMLAHCSVTYEMVYEDKHPKPKGLMKLMLKMLVKNIVVSEQPYKHNERTAPAFLIKDDKNFDAEKTRLVGFLKKTQELGSDHFNNKESLSFGKLTTTEWNNMFYKHLNHHLTQFGV